MITATRIIEFDAAHRVLGHGGACRHLHGHHYKVEVTCQARFLDRLGMVIDFAVIKDRVGGWINAYLDHNILLHKDDPLAKLFNESTDEQLADPDGMFGRKAPFIMDGNPTAENIAVVILLSAVRLLPDTLKVLSVRVYETPNCFAEVTNR